MQALHYFEQLNLRGGLLRLDGEVIAFTFGCKAAPDMYVVQIEKADHTCLLYTSEYHSQTHG